MMNDPNDRWSRIELFVLGFVIGAFVMLVGMGTFAAVTGMS